MKPTENELARLRAMALAIEVDGHGLTDSLVANGWARATLRDGTKIRITPSGREAIIRADRAAETIAPPAKPTQHTHSHVYCTECEAWFAIVGHRPWPKCPNGHPALHRGACEACGEPIAYVTDDDYCGPERLRCARCMPPPPPDLPES